MHRNNLRVREERVEVTEALRSLCLCPWRVAEKDIEPEFTGHRFDKGTDMSNTDDAERRVLQRDGLA